MTAAAWNQLGLGFGMLGVALIFFWGPPQPQFEQGVAIGLEDNTPLRDGLTVAAHNQNVQRLRIRHTVLSRVGLGLVFLGFVCQFVATLC